MRAVPALALPAAAVLALAACSQDEPSPAAAPSGPPPAAAGSTTGAPPDATATLLDASGAEVGVVELTDVGSGSSEVAVEASGLPPGFHGFHVHAVGVCEPASASPSDPSMTGDFLSAGGHAGADSSSHDDHVGDLPSLYVTADGDGRLTTVTDRFAPADLLDGDGSALMVHAAADNFANVPERYAPGGPDETTTGTGDAGGRLACGPVQAP